MSQLTNAVAETIQGGTLMGVLTVVFVAFFVAWTWWAWRPSNRAGMEAAARIPFDDGEAR